MKNSVIYLLAIFSGVILSSCEKEKSGFIDPSLTSPYLVSLSLRDSLLNLDTTTSAAVTRLPNGMFTITDSLTATVSDSDGAGDIRNVLYRLYRPHSSEVVKSGTFDQVTAGGPGSSVAEFRTAVSITIARSDIGAYRFEVSAQDRSGLVSNAQQRPLVLTRNNSRPRTSNLVAPDTIARPPSGFSLVTLTLAASDSDGYNDIAQVFFKRLSPPSSTVFQMLDDGDVQLSGDQRAGDGIFSRTVRIDPSAFLGDQVFLFQARDNTGALSDSLTHTITIIP